MFQNFKKDDDEQTRIDKNLKLMSISAVILIVLFIYTTLKSDTAIQGSGYYIGVAFLFVLLVLTFALQKYKDKIRAKIPKNKFQAQMETANSSNVKEKENYEEPASSIEAIHSNITFKDIAGIAEIKEELEEVVDFLNNPKKYQKFDVSLPKGVLLVGPPGVGKTLIAKAVAGEADVPFFYQSGASFVHIYVGMGAKKVRELFNTAKRNAPSIIFIDEIDAVGKQRGLGSNDEREATLNELLTQMDGFTSSSGVMVIAATNKIEVLDEALLRAGRFDRRVFLNLPNRIDREKILKLYLKNRKYEFDFEKLVNETSGFSSSALSTLINESLLAMIKREGKVISQEDIEQSKQKIQYGKKQFNLLNQTQKDILATYQAGKAFISRSKVCLFDCEVSSDDLVYPSKTQLEDKIKKYLSGSIALEVIKNESYVVSEKELKEAYKIAQRMVEDYKMEDSVDKVIINIKSQLKSEITNNVEEIKQIKSRLLEDEVVVF
jgi:ATP-dependent metalloprotease FtsH